MDLNKIKVTLPNRPEMLQRLRSIVGRTARLERFYSILLEYEGLEGAALGVLTLFGMSVEGLKRSMSTRNTRDLAAIDMEVEILWAEFPLFVDALVVDSSIAIQVKEHHVNILRSRP